MRLLMMGAGALGSVAGGFMAKAGHQVTLVGRAEHMAAIKANGLHMEGIWGRHVTHGLDARTDLRGLEPGAFDVIFITVKSYDTERTIQEVARLVDDNTLVCSYQNGLGNAEIIAETIGWQRTIGARVIYGAWLPEPGRVEVTVIAEPTAIGVYTPGAPAQRAMALADAMNDAGMPTEFTDRIATKLWMKVAYNCALNPLSALLDVPYGRLLDTEDTRRIMQEVIGELYDVARVLGVELDPPTAEGYVHRLFDVLIPPTADHYASMREDFRRRRRTEIEALNGAICRYGEAHGVPTPVNATLTRLIRARQWTYRASENANQKT